MQPTVIPLSKSKVLLLAVASVVFLGAGFWLFNLDARAIMSWSRFRNPPLVHGIGVASLALGAFGTPVFIRKFFDPSPGLVLDERGLTDNSGGFSGGFIPWEDIVGFQAVQFQSVRVLYVLLTDPEKHIAKCNPLMRVLLRANMKIAASPWPSLRAP